MLTCYRRVEVFNDERGFSSRESPPGMSQAPLPVEPGD